MWLEQPHPRFHNPTMGSLLAASGALFIGLGLIFPDREYTKLLVGVCFFAASVRFFRRPPPLIAYAITDRRMLVVLFDVFGKVMSRSYTPDMLETRRVKPDDRGEGGSILLEDRDWGEHEEPDLLRARDLRNVRATATAIDHLVPSGAQAADRQ